MRIRACFVLPVFDPGPGLERTVAGLAPYGLPLYLTDDGSGPETRAQLERLRAREPLIRLSRLERNRGKGAAVLEAFRRAAADGCSHAFQVDADHQHDCAAAASFLALAEANPEAVIAGVPVYDATVPPSRKYGRRFNHFWIHVNTLSRDIGDALCGFRIYPLQPVLRLMDRVRIPERMEFDSEIIIRLHWAGVPVLNAPVAVTYPLDGTSHFRPWRDTLRLVGMHIRLLGGMLARAPRLLLRGRSLPWHLIGERGGEYGFRFAFRCHRLLGARPIRLLSELATLYFLLTSPRARRASRAYLRRLRAASGPLPELPREPGWLEVHRHFRAFTRSTVDKFLAWSGEVRSESFPELDALLARHGGRGALFLGAHLGNLDMMRALGAARGLGGLNAVVFSENAVRFHELLRRANPRSAIDLVQISSVSPATAIALQDKIERGECLFIMGDRVPPRLTGGTVTVPFLGAEAAFPVGPYVLAHLLGCPVYTVFCCRDGDRYRIHLEPLADRVALPRADREAAIQAWASRYASTLEARCRATPFEWFNYYDFWHTDATPG